jgi:hypothetical protein
MSVLLIMKSLKIALALLGSLLLGLGWIFLDDEHLTTSRLITGAIFSAVGFASLYWGNRRNTWKFFVFYQVPFLGLMTWNLARLHPANQTSGIWMGAGVFLGIVAAITFVELRLAGGVSRDRRSTKAEQVGDGDAEEAV